MSLSVMDRRLDVIYDLCDDALWADKPIRFPWARTLMTAEILGYLTASLPRKDKARAEFYKEAQRELQIRGEPVDELLFGLGP